MAHFRIVAAFAVAASFALTGCSSAAPEGGASWQPVAFPAPAMAEPDAVIPAGTYDFTFSSRVLFDKAKPEDTVKASGRIEIGPDVCAIDSTATVVSGGRTSELKIVKPANETVHVYDSSTGQWATDPNMVAFTPLMAFAGAGVSPKADQYASFCALNGIALISEATADGKKNTFSINKKVLAQFIQANADWYINEIIKSVSYAGDTRDAAVKMLQKHYYFDNLDLEARSEEVFTITRDAKGAITVKPQGGETIDMGTFVLTPTKEKVSVKVPVEEVPATWLELIENGVEIAGTLEKYLNGDFPSNDMGIKK